MFIADILIIARIQKWSRSLSMDEWIKKTSDISILRYYSVVLKKLNHGVTAGVMKYFVTEYVLSGIWTWSHTSMLIEIKSFNVIHFITKYVKNSFLQVLSTL